MLKALLYEKLPKSRVRCNICQWRCSIAPNGYGVCRMYNNKDGVLYNINYARASSVAADPIEKKPLFHFHPGSLCFSIGGWGCNFHCLDCQNWQISCPTDDEPLKMGRELPPQTAVEMACESGCKGISWTYNEPTVWFEYTLDGAKAAKEAGLYTVYVTNGYITPQALDLIGPYMDAWALDVKGFSDRFYLTLAKVKKWRGILEVARRAKEKWGIHIEVITNIIPTLNDDDEQLTGIARWVRDEMGESTPWHVTRFHPLYQMRDIPPTPLATLEHAHEIGKQAGLNFVYIGNVPGSGAEDTLCPSCGRHIVQRIGYLVNPSGLDGIKCHHCDTELNFVVEEEKR